MPGTVTHRSLDDVMLRSQRQIKGGFAAQPIVVHTGQDGNVISLSLFAPGHQNQKPLVEALGLWLKGLETITPNWAHGAYLDGNIVLFVINDDSYFGADSLELVERVVPTVIIPHDAAIGAQLVMLREKQRLVMVDWELNRSSSPRYITVIFPANIEIYPAYHYPFTIGNVAALDREMSNVSVDDVEVGVDRKVHALIYRDLDIADINPLRIVSKITKAFAGMVNANRKPEDRLVFVPARYPYKEQ